MRSPFGGISLPTSGAGSGGSAHAATAAAIEAELKLRHYEALSVSSGELRALPHAKLLTLAAELEQLIHTLNGELVAELAHRDELEYIKELQNKFITFIVSIQEQRRRFYAERKRKSAAAAAATSASASASAAAAAAAVAALHRESAHLPQFVTATVPFDEMRHVGVATLESLVKSACRREKKTKLLYA